jgi:histone chaperone ASF1
MRLVNVTNVIVENPESSFLSSIKLNITFECMREMPDSIDWKLIYIGSAKDEKYDQVLDEFEMGPLSPGVMQFNIEADPPKHHLIPTD